jgi:hypothetical protein
MKLVHTVCLGPITFQNRTVVSRPTDKTWPADFLLLLPFCIRCEVFPPLDEIKKEVPQEAP